MTFLPERSPADKPQGDPTNQRTFLIAALRVASARARLATNLFDTIGVALREKMISCDQATSWLVKPQGDPTNQRTFLIAALRVASARARLATNLFDTIGVALREKMISCDQATSWLVEEGLATHVECLASLQAMETKP